MRPIRRTMLTLAVAASVQTLQACGDGLAPPPDPTLRVTVTTTGVDYDADGYLMQGGDVTQSIASVPSVTTYRSLPPGSYELHLEGLAANCVMDGPDVVPVTIVEGHLSSVTFRVQCHATTGAFRVSAPTTGRDFQDASYSATISSGGVSRGTLSVPPNGSATIPGLSAGEYAITLESRRDNCRVTGTNPQTATVTVGGLRYDTTGVVFPVECTATTGDLHLVTVTTGNDEDTDGYTVWRDGAQVIVSYYDGYYPYYHRVSTPLRLSSNAEWYFLEVEPGTYSYELRDLAPSCSVTGANPRAVTVTVGVTSEAVFNVVCSLP